MQRMSETVLGLLTFSEEVITSIGTYGKEIAARLVELWTAAGLSAPDFEGNLTALRDWLTASGLRMSEADQRHVEQLAVNMDLRQQIRTVTGRVYKKFSIIRRVMNELHGEGKAFVLAGIEGPTAQAPRKLLRQCDLALKRLLDPELVLPPHEIDGIEIDAKKLALGLQADVQLLRSLIDEQRQARRVLQKTRKEKNRAIDAHRQTLVWTARAIESYYMLAGENELAERLRPATRRRGRPSSSGSSDPEGQTQEAQTPEAQPPEGRIPDQGSLPEAQPLEGSEPGSASTEA